MKRFNVSRIIQAYQYFSSKDRVGKVVISLEALTARVLVAPATYVSAFNAEKGDVSKAADVTVAVLTRMATGPGLFLLTSSVSGTAGTATESNYCSANGFLDAFAYWRRSRGWPCVSVGLGMISGLGYLGTQEPRDRGFAATEGDPAAQLGVPPELATIRGLSARGFDVTSYSVLVTARTCVLLASLLAEEGAASTAQQGGRAAVMVAAAWFKDVPVTISATLAPEADANTIREVILRMVKKLFSNLILMPSNQIGGDRLLLGFGVDSMITFEFRSWFWFAF
ncbi:hypothetical protein F5Y00DRAFT_266891 [Daldinia vernicosa]|uniref:uncharacterized protein n=1 Tax=Daldinia vernicosa TaxID=114800 RepID=UPI002007A9F2|nr:uncharacterized protein F5Y00DRAFT_266891 [Daldinia vernicosa]KAI0844102.1 hypothetical protein F5Y00DRAFT_266891 [Daldinia vernicosa]